eukprot:scaffold8066_cov403-Prasinococcus_capsulatus_cf.AAC.1
MAAGPTASAIYVVPMAGTVGPKTFPSADAMPLSEEQMVLLHVPGLSCTASRGVVIVAAPQINAPEGAAVGYWRSSPKLSAYMVLELRSIRGGGRARRSPLQGASDAVCDCASGCVWSQGRESVGLRSPAGPPPRCTATWAPSFETCEDPATTTRTHRTSPSPPCAAGVAAAAARWPKASCLSPRTRRWADRGGKERSVLPAGRRCACGGVVSATRRVLRCRPNYKYAGSAEACWTLGPT